MWQVEMAEKLNAATPRERRSVLQPYSEMTGYSPTYLYEIAGEHGFSSGRKKRSDAGSCTLTDEQIDFVAALIHTSKREKKGAIKPVACALEEAIDAGVIESGQISEGHMQRVLADRQLNKKSLDAATPHTQMRSLHPNHTHLVDVSVCIQYYKKNGDTALMDEREFYKNKPQNYEKIKTRLLRYVLTDHFSGAFFFWYYDASGESQNNLYDFLLRAWSFKVDARYPFRGVPFFILMDRGSANTSKAVVAFLGRLGVTIPEGMPYNPRRQGSVETTHNIIEEWFESKLRIQPANTVEDLNRWALDYGIWHNASRKHTRHGMARTECWMLITKEQLRELPDREICQELFTYDDEKNTRLVDGEYCISFKLGSKGDAEGRPLIYNLKHIPGIMPTRHKVLVRIKPFVWPTVDIILNDQSYEVNPILRLPAIQGGFKSNSAVIGQEFKAQPESLTQQAVKRMDNMAYGEERKKDATPFAGMQVMGHHADKLGNLEYMRKRGHAIEIDRGVAEKQISTSELITRLVNAGVTMTKELNKELRAKYGESIDSRQAECIIAEFRGQGSGDSKKQEEGEKLREAL